MTRDKNFIEFLSPKSASTAFCCARHTLFALQSGLEVEASEAKPEVVQDGEAVSGWGVPSGW